MAVTIEKRPIGVVLGSAVTATINQDYNSIYATVNKSSHGLSDGDYVYIKSNVENYNGFWVIDVINSGEFVLRDSPYVEWVVNADITYYPQESTHNWSCVHLPITYELSNTRYPTNSVDTIRTISSISDDNGYVNLNLSGSLGTFEDLSFVKISNAPDTDFDGVYQIIDKLANNDVTINLTYSSVTASGLAGASIQIYYSNYNIVVRVYAGINSGHTWADQKPYELAATLELIPDSSNKVKFSINEILKSYIEVKNNPLQASIPHDINSWTNFYISVAEQYDTSNGYTVTTFEGAFASDQNTFEGYAANAKLPFKNIHSGYLSEYVSSDLGGSFLNDNVGVFTNNYFDVSFIIAQDQSFDFNVMVNNVTIYSDNEAGFYRVPITNTTESGQYCVKVVMPSQTVNTTLSSLASAQNSGGVGIAWTIDSNPNVSIGEIATEYISETYQLPITNGYINIEYTFPFDIDVTINSPATLILSFYFFNSDKTQSEFITNYSYTTSGNKTGSVIGECINFTPSFIGVVAELIPETDADADIDINSLTLSAVPDTQEYNLIDEECYVIDESCSNQTIYLTWLNNLGAYNYFLFTAEKEYSIDITNSGETKQNIFPSWPASYGEFSDTIKKQTFRESNNRIFVFSQYLTQAQADAIAYIKTSPLVQIVNSRQDRRTVIVDTDSFSKYKDGDKTYSISFNIIYTDDIPSQTV